MAASLGTVDIAKVALGGNDIQKISLGAVDVWNAVVFIPVGATVGTATTSGSPFSLMQGWRADPKYPGSTVASNKLVVPAAGKGVTIAASVIWSATSSYKQDVTMRLTLDDKPVGTAGRKVSAPAWGSVTAEVVASGVDVKTGSVVGVEALGESMFNNGPTAQVNASSYLRVYLPAPLVKT